MTPLSELIRAHVPEGMSNRELARRSNGTLSRATVDKYVNGTHGRPTPEILQAFHDVLGIPIQKLREAADLPRGELQPYTPPPEADLLGERQRRALDELIRSIAAPAETPERGALDRFREKQAREREGRSKAMPDDIPALPHAARTRDPRP